MIDERRGRIEFDERGHGPTVVLVPGSCSTGAAWRPVTLRLGNDYRTVTTSLLGYGETDERRTSLDSDISEEAEIVEAVIRRAGGPVHLVGHSFGGVVSLAVALRKKVPLLSLTIIEAPAAELLHHTGEYGHYRAFREMTGNYFASYFAGDPWAIEPMIDFYGGRGTFAAWPPRVRGYAVDTTPVNVFDWANVYGFWLTPELLKTVEVPTLIVRGGESHPAMRCLSALLARYIRGASLVTVPDAAHFVISTHPEEIACAIERHVTRAYLLNASAATVGHRGAVLLARLLELPTRIAAGLAFFALILTAFRNTPLEDRDPERVRREIDRALEAEARSGTPKPAPARSASDARHLQDKKEKLQWLGS